MYHKMKVFGFAYDAIAQRPMVILKDAEETNTVPIWIGSLEAVSIAAELISCDLSSQNGRGDLLSMLLEKMAMRVTMITIDSLNDGVFAASVTLSGAADEIKIDVKPYEALIISLKYKLPVMLADDVMSRASMLAMTDEKIARENDARRFVDFLENLDPSDLGKYPM
jgi:uncharacterized protein